MHEDLGDGDVTTSALFSKRVPAHASIVAQHSLIVAGLSAAVQTFLAVDPALTLTVLRHDGEPAQDGEVILTIDGDGRSILQAERVALNFLQHLSGISTLTHRFCQAVKDYPVIILDTRKTLPGWRSLQKWAVALGGGTNHRYSLGDGLLIKDNHLALLQGGKTSVRRACQLAHRKAPQAMSLIVEDETLAEVRHALACNADVILLISAHLESGHYFNPHAQRILEGKQRGAKLIVLDVRLSNTATHADHWLAPYPGGEAAIGTS